MDKNIWKNYIYNFIKENNLIEFYTKFLERFELEWNKFISDYNFDNLCQLKGGNRLRPMLIFWGYLLNKKNEMLFEISEQDLKSTIKPCIMIESIHKMSLLIDDWIDDDIARHGETTFHIIYGADNAVLLAFNILLKGFLELCDIKEDMYIKIIPLALKISYEMTLGALDEVSSKNKSFDIEKVKEIISLETASIIRNGILIGYKIGEGNDNYIVKTLDEIGYLCGYIFQALNDLEPFGNSQGLVKHKGALTIDILKNRKNIVVSYIYDLGNKDEINKITSKIEPNELKDYISFLIKKYEIKEKILKDISDMHIRIRKCIFIIQAKTNKINWCKYFNDFIDITISASKERALGQNF